MGKEGGGGTEPKLTQLMKRSNVCGCRACHEKHFNRPLTVICFSLQELEVPQSVKEEG